MYLSGRATNTRLKLCFLCWGIIHDFYRRGCIRIFLGVFRWGDFRPAGGGASVRHGGGLYPAGGALFPAEWAVGILYVNICE